MKQKKRRLFLLLIGLFGLLSLWLVVECISTVEHKLRDVEFREYTAWRELSVFNQDLRSGSDWWEMREAVLDSRKKEGPVFIGDRGVQVEFIREDGQDLYRVFWGVVDAQNDEYFVVNEDLSILPDKSGQIPVVRWRLGLFPYLKDLDPVEFLEFLKGKPERFPPPGWLSLLRKLGLVT